MKLSLTKNIQKARLELLPPIKYSFSFGEIDKYIYTVATTGIAPIDYSK